MQKEWYCRIDGQTTGPFTVEELLTEAADGRLGPADRVRRGLFGEWIDAHRLPGMNFPSGAAVATRAAAEDLFVNILAHAFDSAAVRGERLRVLTGGVEPVERFRTCKVVCHRKWVSFWTGSNLPPTEYMGDLIFTDCGLLVTNFATMPKKGESGNHAWLHFGLIGMLVYSIAESRRMSRGKSEAEMHYYRAMDDWTDADLTKIFKRVPTSEFIPADEITRARFTWSGTFEFYHRGFRYTVRPEKKAADPAQRLPSAEEFEEWRTEAAAERATRTDGPANGGPGALAEWGARTATEVRTPPWVAAAVRRTEEKWGTRFKDVLTWIPKPYHPHLFFRLATVDSPDATAWHQRLGKRLRLRGYIFLAVALVLGLVAAGFGVVATSLTQQKGDDWIGPTIVGGLIGFIGMILLLWGSALVVRFRDHPAHHADSAVS